MRRNVAAPNLQRRNSISNNKKQRWVVIPGRICLVFSSALPKSGSRLFNNARDDRTFGMRSPEASTNNKELPLLDDRGDDKDSSGRGHPLKIARIKHKWDRRKQKAKQEESSETSMRRPWALFSLRRRRKARKIVTSSVHKGGPGPSYVRTTGSEETRAAGVEEEEEGSELCKKRILMGHKCRALNSSGNLHYGPDGILLPEFLPYDD